MYSESQQVQATFLIAALGDGGALSSSMPARSDTADHRHMQLLNSPDVLRPKYTCVWNPSTGATGKEDQKFKTSWDAQCAKSRC